MTKQAGFWCLALTVLLTGAVYASDTASEAMQEETQPAEAVVSDTTTTPVAEPQALVQESDHADPLGTLFVLNEVLDETAASNTTSWYPNQKICILDTCLPCNSNADCFFGPCKAYPYCP